MRIYYPLNLYDSSCELTPLSSLYDTEWNDTTAIGQQDNDRSRYVPSWLYEPWSSTPPETPFAPPVALYYPSRLQDPSPELQFSHLPEGYWDELNLDVPTAEVHIEESVVPQPNCLDPLQLSGSVHMVGYGIGTTDEPQVATLEPSPMVPDL